MDDKLKLLKLLLLLFFTTIGLKAQDASLPYPEACSEPYKFVNLGPNINTPDDEFLPVVYKEFLYFRRTVIRNGQPVSNTIMQTLITGNEYNNPVENFKLIDPENVGYNPETGTVDKLTESDVPVDTTTPRSEEPHPIFMDPSTPSFYNYAPRIKRWFERISAAADLNTDLNDMHPAIAADGSFIVFASTRENDNSKGGSDLYISRRLNIGRQNWDEFWTEPQNMNIRNNGSTPINTEYNEISPFIGVNDTLYFASNGFREDAGQIYISGQRTLNAVTRSDVHALEQQFHYDIIKAAPIYNDDNLVIGYENPQKLPEPVNTQYNEIGPTIHYNAIIISSDRPGGYGNFDLYGCALPDCRRINLFVEKINKSNCHPRSKIDIFDENDKLLETFQMPQDRDYEFEVDYSDTLFVKHVHECHPDGIIDTLIPECWAVGRNDYLVQFKMDCFCVDKYMPVLVTGQINCKNLTYSGGGRIEVYDSLGILTAAAEVGFDGKYKVKADYSGELTVSFHDDCLPTGRLERVIIPQPSTGDMKEYVVDFDLPVGCCLQPDLYSVRGIPFFVTGYYKPNTKNNLMNLNKKYPAIKRLLIANNSNVYIANPFNDTENGKPINYWIRADIVQQKIEDIRNLILNKLSMLAQGYCSKIIVTVAGYADPRKIPKPAYYVGNNIMEPELIFRMHTGVKMDNDKLSVLRAYYTLREIKALLAGTGLYANFKDKIEWHIRGAGIDRANVENKLKRKVEVKIECD